MKPYKLSCREWNPYHVKFNVFDPTGANCGELTVLASDVENFVQHSWRGNIFWNGLMPVALSHLIEQTMHDLLVKPHVAIPK